MAFQLNISKRRTKERDIKKRDDLVLQLTMKGWSSKEIGMHPELNYAITNGQCQRIIQIQNILVEQDRLKKNEQGSFIIPVTKITEHKWQRVGIEIAQTVPEIKRMYDYMVANNKDPQDTITQINGITVLCNTLNIHPAEIINSQTLDGQANYISKARECLLEMQKHQNAGTTIRNARGSARLGSSVKLYKDAIRTLLFAHDKNIRKLPITDILSGTKGQTFGAYNGIGLTDKQHQLAIEFIEKNGKDILGKYWDFGYIGLVTLMPEMITRTESIAQWLVNFTTEYDEYERCAVEFDFIGGFYESKTAKSKPQGWDKFVIEPYARKVLQQLSEYRKGKTIVPFNDTKLHGVDKVKDGMNILMKEFYINQGILPSETRLKFKDRPTSAQFKIGTTQHFFDSMGAYVLRHTGAHRWCRRTKYDYGFVAELGWTDLNTLRDCYAGMDIRARMKQNECFYCNPPMNPDMMINKTFCSATHAFIYYSNGQKPKVKSN